MDVSRWGLSLGAIADLGKRLDRFWRYYGQWTRTRTRDTRHYGLLYLKGLLRMKIDRNMAEIAREASVSEQNMQHFISNSPWSGSEMIEQVQQAVWGTRRISRWHVAAR